MGRATLDRGARLTLFALLGILAVTAAWWALALWPTAGAPPEWLARARAVCFNAGPDGLPDVSGWMLLIGQPMGMLGFLVVVWPAPLFRGVRWLTDRPSGWATLAGALVLVLGGLTGAGVRVARASAAQAPPRLPQMMAAADHPRLDQEAPELGLVDQRGDRVTLADLEGRPALVTFAFGHCGDICPVVVESARRARDDAWGTDGAALVVVTLDPWRDTPPRLSDLAERWG
ncbi:MAG TPA: SCO family protein, partial [Longimicrobiales bacterium]